MAATQNLVDIDMRPVRAFGLLERQPQPSITEREGELSEQTLAHERSADEQMLVSSLLNRALGAPGAFHAGHLITRHLGGSFARHNMVPMNRVYNAWGTYKQFEHELDAWVENATKTGQEVLYPGRVYIDLAVSYPDDNHDDDIFRDLVAPDAVTEIKLQAWDYWDYLRRLCRRVPVRVELKAARKYFMQSGMQGWKDFRESISAPPERGNPRHGGPPHYITKSNWRVRHAAWLKEGGYLGGPSTDPYYYKEPDRSPSEVERDRHAHFAFGQIWLADTALDPRSKEAREAGRTDVELFSKRVPIMIPMPPRAHYGARIDPAKHDIFKALHPMSSVTKMLETRTMDELVAEVDAALDPGFLDWLRPGKSEAAQRAALRDLLNRTPPIAIATLLADYENHNAPPV